MKTEHPIQTHADILREKHAKELALCEAEAAIAALLPKSLPMPTISNVNLKNKPLQPHAWLSFSPEYRDDAKAFALRIFTELETHGAKPLPLSLVKWGSYRRHVEFGLVDSIPDEKRGCFGSTDKLTDVEPIAPLWITPCQFTGNDAQAFYEIGGKVFRVSVDIPAKAHLSCRKIENFGGWRFDGACTVQFPQAWHSIHTESGESVANISHHTHGYRDTEQGISGTIYWQPLTEQDKFPLTPAQFLAKLLV